MSSGCSISDVASALSHGLSNGLYPGLGFMETYIFKDRVGTLNVIREAERCGMKAIVLTLDSPVVPWGREPQVLPIPEHATMPVMENAGLIGVKYAK